MVAFGLGKRAFRSDSIALIPEAEFTPDQQLKTGVFVISRIQHHAECGEMNVKAACKTAAVELSAADQLLKTHTEMKKLQKHDSNRPSSKTPRNLDERLLDFKSRMGDGYPSGRCGGGLTKVTRIHPNIEPIISTHPSIAQVSPSSQISVFPHVIPITKVHLNGP